MGSMHVHGLRVDAPKIDPDLAHLPVDLADEKGMRMHGLRETSPHPPAFAAVAVVIRSPHGCLWARLRSLMARHLPISECAASLIVPTASFFRTKPSFTVASVAATVLDT